MASKNDQNKDSHSHHHFILPDSLAIMVWGCLMVLTVITVAVSHVNLGPFNLLVAILVASVKATLVALFFMGLKYDRLENGVIFATSFLFLAIFITLTGTDLFFRGDVAVKGPLIAEAAQTESKFSTPWVPTPELLSFGAETFKVQCISCHGSKGMGDGPASGSLNPRPRNFTQGEGWTNGRRPTQIFKTLAEGVKGTGMPSFSTLPKDTRWALTYYVASLGPAVAPATHEELEAIGIDPNKADGGAVEAATIPIDVAMKRMTAPSPHMAGGRTPVFSHLHGEGGAGAETYQAYCAKCHGGSGVGGVQVVPNGSVSPQAFVVTEPFSHSASLASMDHFGQVVRSGLPGRLMPGMGNLSQVQARELYDYVKSLPGAR